MEPLGNNLCGRSFLGDLRGHRSSLLLIELWPSPATLTLRLKMAQKPRDLRTHILRLLVPKTKLYKAFGLF